MPRLTPEGKRVAVARAAHVDVETPDIANLSKLAFMIADIRLKEEKTGMRGDVYVLDASVALVKHFVKVSPAIVKKFFVCLQEAYPIKVKEIHVINATPLVDFIIKWLTPLLKEKIRKRIHIHDSLESLYEFVPKETMPEEYGGTAGKLDHFVGMFGFFDIFFLFSSFLFIYLWMKTLEEYTPWFKEQESIKADESKRPGKPTFHEELFGLDGSFKQLTID